jgi:copper chaperone
MIELKVDGMTCGHCSAAVQRALEAVAGVVAVRVDREQGRAWVEGNSDVDALIAAVVEEGYASSRVAA